MESIPQRNLGAAAVQRGLRNFGYRNLAYLAFTLLMIPFAMAAEASGPHGPESGGAIAAVMLWAVISAGSVVVNLILLVAALVNGGPAMPPLIACALPVAVAAIAFALDAAPVR